MLNWTAFFSYAVLNCFTPGPNNIMAMTNASRHGFRKGYRFCIGAFLGFLLVLLLSAAFSTLLYQYIPRIQPAMKAVGVVYILWLAWVVVRDKPHAEKKHRLETNSAVTGILLQLINVKGVLFSITMFSTFISPYYKTVLPLAAFALFLAAIGLTALTVWALFGSLFQRVFEQHKRVVNIIMALLLVYCAYSIGIG